MDTPGVRQKAGRNPKRQRSRNFTKYEKEVFYSLFSQYAGVINNKQYAPDSIRDAWTRLLADYNSHNDVFPRTRRQLQVLWRDEKFRAKKRGRQDQGDGLDGEAEEVRTKEEEDEEDGEDMEEGRATSSLLSPLLAVIKQEQEALTAEAAAATEAAAAATTHYTSSPSPDLYINSNTEEGPSSPLPVETQLDSCSSSSPLPRAQDDEDEDEGEEEEGARLGSFPSHRDRSSSHLYHHPRPPSNHWLRSNGVASVTSQTEEREREYHRARMTQLREEGAARLRLLEAELALHHQERHSRQQEHQLRVQILMEKLRSIRERHS